MLQSPFSVRRPITCVNIWFTVRNTPSLFVHESWLLMVIFTRSVCGECLEALAKEDVKKKSIKCPRCPEKTLCCPGCNKGNSFYTLYIVLYIVHITLHCTLHCTLCIVHCIVDCTLHILHCIVHCRFFNTFNSTIIQIICTLHIADFGIVFRLDLDSA